MLSKNAPHASSAPLRGTSHVSLRLLALALGLIAPAAALAADLPSRTAPPPPPALIAGSAAIPDWRGFYVGGQASWLNLRTYFPKLSGYGFGVRAGYDAQSGRWVYGVLAEGEWTTLNGAAVQFDVKTPLRAGLNARLGYALGGSTLLYGLAGGSWLDFDVSTPTPNPPTRAFGYVLGAGAEFAISGPWTVYAESRFARHFADHRRPFNGSEVRLGVNYRFSRSASAPFIR